MTEVDRDIALVLLKRLWQRELISDIQGIFRAVWHGYRYE